MKRFALSLLLVCGCAKQTTALTPLSGTAGLETPTSHCSWVQVSETNTVTFLGLTLSEEVRQFNKQLFFCCPGENLDQPKCYQAGWFEFDASKNY